MPAAPSCGEMLLVASSSVLEDTLEADASWPQLSRMPERACSMMDQGGERDKGPGGHIPGGWIKKNSGGGGLVPALQVLQPRKHPCSSGVETGWAKVLCWLGPFSPFR